MSYGILCWVFSLIFSSLSNWQLQVVLDGKFSQELLILQLMLEFLNPQGFCTFLLYMNDVPDDVICDIVFYVDDTTLYSRCD